MNKNYFRNIFHSTICFELLLCFISCWSRCADNHYRWTTLHQYLLNESHWDILVPCFTWTQDPEWSFVLTHSTSYLNLFVFAVAQLFALIYWFFLHCLVRRNACSFLTEGRPRPSWHSKQHTEKKNIQRFAGLECAISAWCRFGAHISVF